MTNYLALDDLITNLDSLDKSLKACCEKYLDCWIYDGSDTYCNCGCRNTQIGNIIIRLENSKGIRQYGLRIYPTEKCKIGIMNCDNKGAVIGYDIFKSVETWLNNLPRPIDRQLNRINCIKQELIQKNTQPSQYENII
jgi:hypothetical protein